jgi:hypothetical protein
MDVHDRGRAIGYRALRLFQGGCKCCAFVDAYSESAERPDQRLVIDFVDRLAVEEPLPRPDAIGVIGELAVAHRAIAVVVVDDDQQGKLRVPRHAEAGDHRVVDKRAVTDQARDEPLAACHLHAERDADPLAESCAHRKVALRAAMRQIATIESEMNRRLVDVDRIGGQRVAERRAERDRMDARSCASGFDRPRMSIERLRAYSAQACTTFLDHAASRSFLLHARAHGVGEQLQRRASIR